MQEAPLCEPQHSGRVKYFSSFVLGLHCSKIHQIKATQEEISFVEMNKLLESPHSLLQLHTMPGALWTPTCVSLVYQLQQAHTPLKDCNFFFGGDVICFTAVPFMDQDPIMQNVVYTGRTSECYPIIQQRHEKPGQVEGGLQEKRAQVRRVSRLLCVPTASFPWGWTGGEGGSCILGHQV